MSNRKNPRLVKVKTIMDSEDVKLILSSNAINSRLLREKVIDSSSDIRKNDDDNTALIQRDLSSFSNRIENVLNKVLCISCILILINVIILCIC